MTASCLFGCASFLCRLLRFSASDLISRESPGMPLRSGGVGVYATQAGEAGVRILAEPLLVALPTYVEGQKPNSNAMLLRAVPKANRDAFHQMFDCRPTGGPINPQGIFNTNSFLVDGKAGVFVITLHFNHSCAADCTHTWNSKLGMLTVQTDRNVRCGEELMVAYCNYSTDSWRVRQDALKSKYNFSCHCEVCKVTGEARKESDKRLAKIGVLVEDMLGALKAAQWRTVVQVIEQHLHLLAEEGIKAPGHMTYLEYIAYTACKLLQKHGEARTGLEKANMHSVMAEGNDSVIAQKNARFLAMPFAAPLME